MSSLENHVEKRECKTHRSGTQDPLPLIKTNALNETRKKTHQQDTAKERKSFRKSFSTAYTFCRITRQLDTGLGQVSLLFVYPSRAQCANDRPTDRTRSITYQRKSTIHSTYLPTFIPPIHPSIHRSIRSQPTEDKANNNIRLSSC